MTHEETSQKWKAETEKIQRKQSNATPQNPGQQQKADSENKTEEAVQYNTRRDQPAMEGRHRTKESKGNNTADKEDDVFNDHGVQCIKVLE